MKHRPRKRFGQNFLHDQSVIQRIVDAIDPRPGQHLVEIGPGQGALTRPLLERAGALEVIELDRDLIEPLRLLDNANARLTVYQADALRFDFGQLVREGRLRVVGNLPYNISTPLLFHLLDQAAVIEDMHFMLQKEVVERMAAQPGGGDWGRLSVMIQYRCAVTPLFVVRPGAFHPPPKVDSMIVRLTPYATPPVTVTEPALLSKVVNQAFSMRRKTLRNALKGWVSPEQWTALAIDSRRRPETLSLAEFAVITNCVRDPRSSNA
ncbi:MAG: 16S rRNA (adenine(1518)-N(6)/adenine(1519)-N(6))-dimethyltransferase RsmA [Proteobacteria bacterium]|nr:MAG: 16S rRNA (adenine(1518)-N(6)/adenine(1519)-N(6))-dimethyltransferase RsmA [Pseudomonadota bacterium]QKK11324.1 MAG: 16S rRNA (adenine(1518)-N(6)/adenine(1519)-N(6))-dimethyltransferase RsmA [Pseudomonadota bacterium]